MFRVLHPNRWFLWAIAILLAAGLGLLAAITETSREIDEQSVTPPAFSTWKTFRSESLGLKVSYPSSWQIEMEKEIPEMVTLENPKNFNENLVMVVTEPKFEETIRSALNIVREQEIVIDGYPGSWLKGEDLKDYATHNVVLLQKDGRLYYFAGYARSFEKIVGGIKFLPAKIF